MNAVEISHQVLAEQETASRLPATEQLLVAGGDARIVLNPATGANKYGCHPRPDVGIAAFGSATATTISETSFFAADQLRNRLTQLLRTNPAGSVYADEIHRIRHELMELCGLGSGHGLDIVFAASGTDAHLIAAQLFAGDGAMMQMLMVDAAETGSGVPAALSGLHFSSRAALGDAVVQGAPIAGNFPADCSAIPIRQADGTPRPGADIDADFERQVVVAAEQGKRVLLALVDVSKTGMIAPSVACAVALHRRFPGTVEVMVDACQFRIAPATLQAYLNQGFMVLITGSKFITGPSFSGALLIPAALSRKLHGRSAAEKLLAYSTRADWPIAWEMSKHLDDAPNFGLLLRWEGALKELREFRSVSNAVTMHFLQAFAQAINLHLSGNPVFQALPVPELQRYPFADSPSWDTIQTIFPFLLFHAEEAKERAPLNREQTLRIYRALQEDPHEHELVQLAQPVACGSRNGIEVSALRLCVSSRLVVEAMQQNGRNEQVVIRRALRALDKVAQLVRAS